MDAAKEWGIPPWEIAGGSPVLWFARFEMVREINIEVSNMKDEDIVLDG